jgi:RNA polymerase sigma-70 factor, ECF subfamily
MPPMERAFPSSGGAQDSAQQAASIDDARLALLVDEAGLVERVRGGDRDAFGAIFAVYAGSLYAYAQRVTRSQGAAEEVVHEVFLRIWEIRETWRVESVGAYLHGAVRRRALNFRRDEATREALEGNAAPAAGEVGEVVAGIDSPEDVVVATDLANAAARAIGRLSPRNREAYLLHRQHHLTYAEIAMVLGVTPKAVERQIGRALQALRALLAAYLALAVVIGR